MRVPLKDSLSGKIIVEYPVITVALPERATAYPLARDLPPPADIKPAETDHEPVWAGSSRNLNPDYMDDGELEEGEVPSSKGEDEGLPSPAKRRKRGGEMGGGFTIAADGSIVKTASLPQAVNAGPVEEIDRLEEVIERGDDACLQDEAPAAVEGVEGKLSDASTVISAVQAALMADLQ